MDATCERLLGTLRREVLDRMLIRSAAHLHAVLAEYQVHYNMAGRIRASTSGFPAVSAKSCATPQPTSMPSESAENPY
jgi:hypothetical protein